MLELACLNFVTSCRICPGYFLGQLCLELEQFCLETLR